MSASRKTKVIGTLAGLAAAYAVLSQGAKWISRKENAGLDADNPYLDSAAETTGNSEGAVRNKSIYEKAVKPALDKGLSFAGLVALAPVYGLISLAILADDPGPVLFSQKRIGKDKHFFKLHKFRSMKMDTPHDVPTHLLDNPDQYITRVGKFLRKTSLDELPQIWDIFAGNLSIIGPRPALWNQEDLIAQRDLYGANDIQPGLTGWAQINGRDELEIEEKARLDGEYTEKLHGRPLEAMAFDAKCFGGTITSVFKSEGVVEGGTGQMHKEQGSVEEESDQIKPKKILFLANHFITLHAFRNELIERLVKDGYEVYLSLPPSEENEHFEKMGCHIVETNIDRRGVDPKKDLELIRFYRKMIPEIDPDIIFSYTIKPNIYGALANPKQKYPQVCNITGTGATFLKENLVSKICRMLYQMSTTKAKKVFFQNNGDRDYFIQHHMVKDNYDMLPGSGVNLEKFQYKSYPKEDENIKFIFIGRVMELKGIDEYLEAARIIKKEYPNTTFYIAGWNEEEEYKKKVEEASDVVEYLGFRKDVADWMEKCHATILPSHGGEGISNVMIESAATGRVCIGSNISGVREIIEPGKTGYLFEPGNAVDLADQIRSFLALSSDEKEAMGLAGRKKMEKEFDRNIVINKYLQEIADLDR